MKNILAVEITKDEEALFLTSLGYDFESLTLACVTAGCQRRRLSAVDVISVIECAKGNGEITCQRSGGSRATSFCIQTEMNFC